MWALGLFLPLFPAVTLITLLLFFGWRELKQWATLPIILWLAVLTWLFATLWHSTGWLAVAQGVQVAILPLLFLLGRRLSALLRQHQDAYSLAFMAVLTAMLLVSLLQVNGVGLAYIARLTVVFAPLESFYEAARLAYKSGRATGWLSHPNIWAAASLVPGFFVLLFTQSRWRWFVIPLMALIIILSGSRASFLGFAVGVGWVAIRFVINRGLTRIALTWGVFGATAMLALLLFTPLGTRFWSTLNFFRSIPEPAPRNLFQASEVLTDTFWFERSVRVEPIMEDMSRDYWRIEKTGDAASSRLQQRLSLEPGTVYTLSVELYSETLEAIPGLLSWVRVETGIQGLSVRFSNREWQATTRGQLELISFRTDLLVDGWTRIVVSIKNTSESYIPFPIGVTPDQRNGPQGASILVRKVQLEVGNAETAYEATFPPDRKALRAQQSAEGRLDIFQVAWQGFLQKPIVGWGDQMFPSFYQRFTGSTAVIGHAHNLVLQTLFAKGCVGLSALVFLIAGFFYASKMTSRWGRAGILLVTILTANMFDITFWTAQVSYLLVFVLGIET